MISPLTPSHPRVHLVCLSFVFIPAVVCCCAQLYPTVCDPTDCSPPGSSVHGISQARILEWVAISSFQAIFLTQGSNLHLPNWQANSLPLSHLGSSVKERLVSITSLLSSKPWKLLWASFHYPKSILQLLPIIPHFTQNPCTATLILG